MTRKAPLNPFAAYFWLAEAGFVFAMHSAQLWMQPGKAAGRLAALGAEKQQAFAEGAMQAGMAALRGAPPQAMANAAMAPARRRVKANKARILKGKTLKGR